MGKSKEPATAADLPAAEQKAQDMVNLGMAVAGATLPTAGAWRPNAVATEIAETLGKEGFRVSINRGNGPVGQSSYLNIFDPQTKRYLAKEVRVSDHMVGGTRMPHYNHVTGPDDVPAIYEMARAMRARGLPDPPAPKTPIYQR